MLTILRRLLRRRRPADEDRGRYLPYPPSYPTG